MPPFDQIMPNIPLGLNSAIGDLAATAWQTPLDLGRMRTPEPEQLTFPDVFGEVGATPIENLVSGMEETFKNASNVEFSTAEQNEKSGTRPDFFVDASGKLFKNPNAQSKPGDPLNVEIQSTGSELASKPQGSVIQAIIDTFLANHPGMPSFPHTWQEALQLLQRSMTGTDAGASIANDNAAYRSQSRSIGSAGGGDSGGNSANIRDYSNSGTNARYSNSSSNSGVGDSASTAIRPVDGLAPPVVVKGKAFPVSSYSGSKLGLHHGASDGAADIFAPEGTPIVAMLEGEVIGVSSDGLGGNTIKIKQKDGNVAYYAHMQALPARADGTPLKKGDQIKTGEVIGRVGETGNAAGTGAHLHLGVGKEIQSGSGPEGGAGTNFDLTATLNEVLTESRNV